MTKIHQKWSLGCPKSDFWSSRADFWAMAKNVDFSMPLRGVEKSIKIGPRAPKGRHDRSEWAPGRPPHGSRVPGAAPISKIIDKSMKTTTMVQDLTRRWAEGPANLLMLAEPHNEYLGQFLQHFLIEKIKSLNVFRCLETIFQRQKTVFCIHGLFDMLFQSLISDVYIS